MFHHPSTVVVSIAGAVCAIVLALILPWPRRLSLAIRYESVPVFLFVFLAFLVLFSLPTRWRRLLSLPAIIFLFLIPLAALWVSGANEPNTVFGLLPWFDARGYFSEASRLLDGWQFSEISARRPLFPAFFSALLGLTGRNLMASLAVLAVVNAFAACTFSGEIRRRYGASAGALGLTLVFFFFRRFAGSVLTEALGLPLALFGFTLLFQSIDILKPCWLFVAAFLLSLAMNTRPGAFFTLPALILWIAWQGQRIGGWRTAFKYAAVVLAGIAAGFLINYLLFLLLTRQITQPFSNFAYTLYGLAVGGKGWTQVFSDHPEVNALVESQRAGLVYRLTLEEIQKDPSRLYSGVLLAVRAMLAPSSSGLFGFVGRLYGRAGSPIEIALRLFLLVLSTVSLCAGFLRKKGPLPSLFIFLTAGVILSAPFAPPWDADQMRAYAASVPLIVALPAAGLGTLVFLARKTAIPPESANMNVIVPASSGLLLAFSTAVLPLLFYFSGSTPAPPIASCPAGQESVTVRLNPGSGIQILPDNQLVKTRLPALRQNDFSDGLVDFPQSRGAGDFKDLTAPAAIYPVVDLAGGEETWLVFSDIPDNVDGNTRSLCGYFDSSTDMRRLFRVAQPGQ